MGKSTTYAGGLLGLVLNATPIANIADNAASGPLANLYLSLHTADPGVGGAQTSNEAAYTSYARRAIARSAGSPAWTISTNSASPAAAVNFPQATGGSETELFWAVGTAASGTGLVLYSGVLGTAAGAFTAVASTDAITVPGASFSVGDRIAFFAADTVALPSGLAAGTVYWVKTVSGSAITVSTSSGGATLDITADGGGRAYKDVGIPVSLNVTPSLTTGTQITEQ